MSAIREYVSQHHHPDFQGVVIFETGIVFIDATSSSGFNVSRDAGLAGFCAKVSGISLNIPIHGFSKSYSPSS